VSGFTKGKKEHHAGKGYSLRGLRSLLSEEALLHWKYIRAEMDTVSSQLVEALHVREACWTGLEDVHGNTWAEIKCRKAQRTLLAFEMGTVLVKA